MTTHWEEKKLNDNLKSGENDLKTEEGDLKEEKARDTLSEMKIMMQLQPPLSLLLIC